MHKLLLFLLSFVISGNLLASTEDLERKIDILAEEVEKLKLQDRNPKAESFFGLGRAASAVYGVADGLSIGGYGEIVLNIPSSEREDGSLDNSTAEGEALRGVLYIGNKFNDNWVLNTEIEIEHTDEIFLEFAYIDYLHSKEFNFRSGLVLLPMGLVNEQHEPIYFNSVNRPEVETRIIPSTWRELGFGFLGTISKLDYRVYLVNGFNADGFNSSGLRGGRKKGGVVENASTVAFVGRLDYRLTSNFLIGGSIYSGTASGPTNGNVGVNIYQGHVDFTWNNIYGRALYVAADLDDTERFNASSNANLAQEQEGYYAETGYNFRFKEAVLTPFIRFEEVDTQKKLDAGLTKDQAQDTTNLYLGVAFQPIDRIVYKFDYVKKENGANTGVSEFNFGIGYIF